MQKINFKKIHTHHLWKNFELDADNIVIEDDGLKLASSYIYKSGKVVLDDGNFNISDIAVNECSIIYFIDQNRNLVFTYEKDTGTVNTIGCNSGILSTGLNSPSSIAIDKDTIYIADNGNARIVAIARSNLQIRWILSKGPKSESLGDISDLAVDEDGNIYAVEMTKNRILCMDRSSSISGVIGSDQLSQPTDIALDNDGNIYVLDKSSVYIFRHDKELIHIHIDGIVPKGLAVDINKQIFIGESGLELLKKKTIYKLDPVDGKLIPLWSYRGAVNRLINDIEGNLYVINDKGDQLTLLPYTKVYNSNDDGVFRGTFISKPIDSQVIKNKWHRSLLEGVFKPGTQIELLYFISDKKPSKDSEITDKSDNEWLVAISDTSSFQGEERRDALFLEDIAGQYLWFKIILTGSETISPEVSSFMVYFPRISYLDHLPAMYQEDPISRSFLEHFLSIFESIFYEIDVTVEHIERFFDANGAPVEFLSWLGSWVALSMDENWSEEKKRSIIQHAVSLYKKRGTREGLEDTIELLTDHKPLIVENFYKDHKSKVNPRYSSDLLKSYKVIFFPPGEAMIKSSGGIEVPLVDVLYGNERFGFCVFLDRLSLKENSLDMIKRVIEDQKPAHTCYGLTVMEPWFYLDMHTYLSINTALTKPEFILGKSSVIGRDTVLDDFEHAAQVGRHSRIDIDTELS